MCENFGLTPEEIEEKAISNKYIEKGGKRQPVKLSTFYTLHGTGPKSSSIICKGCLEFARTSPHKNQTYYSLKSNRGIYEEYERIAGYLTKAGSKCVNTNCESTLGTKPVSIKKRGKTPKGTQRYYCNVCKTSFTGKPIDRVHDNTQIDIYFFRTLVSRTPLARIAKLYGISMPTLYRRIDFIHRKCVEFVANRERKLISKKYERMYLCTDRQVYISNWVNRKEKKNCEFYVIGTADLTSSYILAYNFNYDPNLNPEEIERHAEELGDHEKKKHHRHYARAWLKRDFEAIKATKGKKHPAKGASLKEDLEQQIAFNEFYDPDSASESYGQSNQLPTKGMEITTIIRWRLIFT